MPRGRDGADSAAGQEARARRIGDQCVKPERRGHAADAARPFGSATPSRSAVPGRGTGSPPLPASIQPEAQRGSRGMLSGVLGRRRGTTSSSATKRMDTVPMRRARRPAGSMTSRTHFVRRFPAPQMNDTSSNVGLIAGTRERAVAGAVSAKDRGPFRAEGRDIFATRGLRSKCAPGAPSLRWFVPSASGLRAVACGPPAVVRGVRRRSLLLPFLLFTCSASAPRGRASACQPAPCLRPSPFGEGSQAPDVPRLAERSHACRSVAAGSVCANDRGPFRAERRDTFSTRGHGRKCGSEASSEASGCHVYRPASKGLPAAAGGRKRASHLSPPVPQASRLTPVVRRVPRLPAVRMVG